MVSAAAGRGKIQRYPYRHAKPSYRHAKLWCAVFAFPVLLGLLSGCGGRPTVLLYMEPYWQEFFRGSLEELRGLVKSHGFQQKTVATDGDYDGVDWAALETPLRENRTAVVVLSPFMKPLAAELAGRNPGITFLLLAGAAGAPGAAPPNLVFTSFDRVPVFREAGEAAGRMLSELRERGTTGREPEQRVAVVYTREGRDADAEIEAFRDGFARTADAGLLFSRLLEDNGDAIKARAIMEEAKNQNAFFIFLHLQNLLPTCLDFLSAEGGWAIIADWERSFGYRDSVVMSVEEDYVDAIGQVLSGTARGDAPGNIVAGRVYLSVNPRYLEGMSAGKEEDAAAGRGKG